MTATISAPALVPVFSGNIQNTLVQLCDARTLHARLNSKQEFANWIRGRIDQYGFIEGEDFLTNLSKTRGRPRTDYHLTLNMAKELAMIENNDIGREVRRYFIRLETHTELSGQPGQFITAAQAGELSALIAGRFPDGRDRPYAWGRFNNHFRIARYRELPAARFAEACAYIGSMQPRALPALANTAASRIDAAYKMASHVAAVAAQAVFKAALSDEADDITYKYGRWLFCMDWNGTDPAPYAKRVDNDAMIVSLAKLPSYLADPGLLATNKELADISAACCRRLAQRMANPPAAPARRLSS